MNKLKVAVLLLCAALCVSCENPFLKGLLPQDIERNIIGQSPTVPDPEAPFVEGAASIIAAAATPKTMFRISVVTVDNSAVAVEGEDGIVTTLASGTYTTLIVATGATVILRGNIKSIDYSIHNASSSIDVRGLSNLQYLYCYNSSGLTSIKVQGCASLQGLYCKGNRLTSLNVQGCSSLQTLFCYSNQLTSLNVQGLSALQALNCTNNQLTAQAFTKLFTDLPVRSNTDNANCYLYTERTDITEGNHTDFTSPSDLQAAFNHAKNVKKWTMYKIGAKGGVVL